jgi:hypothetical protein
MTAAKQDRKKVIWLGGTAGVLLLYSLYTNVLSGPSTPASAGTTSRPAAASNGAAGDAVAMAEVSPKTGRRSRINGRQTAGEFHPVYLATRAENRPDVTRIDPTMRLDLLAKVQEVDAAGGARNLFAFGPPPPPPVVERPKGPETRVPLGGLQAQQGGPQGGPVHPEDLPLQINLKYYGIVSLSRGGKKTACFLDTSNNEEILLATEGDTLKRRFRVMKIGASSVIMQDTESKREQTLPLAQEAKGS